MFFRILVKKRLKKKDRLLHLSSSSELSENYSHSMVAGGLPVMS